MSGAVILTPGDRVMLAQAPRKRGYLTPEQQAFDDERRRVSRENAWMAIPALAPAAAVAAMEGVPAVAGMVRGLASRARINRAARAVEDVFGRGEVIKSTPRNFVARSQDGSAQLRMDLKGHKAYEPHFHLESAPLKGGPSDLLDKHMFFFKK